MTKANKNHKKIAELKVELRKMTQKRALNRKIEELKFEVEEFESLQKENEDNLEKLSNLYKLLVIDKNGYFVNNMMEYWYYLIITFCKNKLLDTNNYSFFIAYE